MDGVVKTVHVSTGSGKLKNIPSVNTSSLENTFCQAMAETNAICGSCYSNRLTKFRSSLEDKLKQNRELLASRALKDWEIPRFNARYVRFSSFGELENNQHMENFIAIARANPWVTFGLWTKRHTIAMQYDKEPNIQYIYSVAAINGKKPAQNILDYFDRTFTAVTKDKEANCHGACIDCLLCYTDNNVKHIYEHKK